MKKTLVLASLLAAFGAASAQSSVTLYGQVQAGIFGSETATGVKTKAHINANNGDSRVGFRGTEAIGNGASAFFDLQHRFNPENGLTDNDGKRPFWQGKSTVGLRSPMGAIEIGRQLTAFQGPVGGNDPFGVSTAGSVHVLGSYSTDPSQAGGAGLGRTDIINVTSANYSGFTGSVGYGFATSVASGTATVNPKAISSYWLGYGAGKLAAGVGGEQNRVGDKITAGFATYDFGVAKVFLAAQSTDVLAVTGSKESATTLGVTAPFGPVVVKAGYKMSKAEKTAVKSNKMGLGVDYKLSPRTMLSANYGSTKAKGASSSATGYDLFVQHNF